MDDIELIPARDVLPRMQQDFPQEEHLKLWCYTVEPKFFEQTFLRNRDNKRTSVLLDHRQRDRLTSLMTKHNGLFIRTWQRNRTQHDKTIILPTLKVIWFTTSNLHRGSFLLANNRAIRVTRASVIRTVERTFEEHWTISTPVEPLRNR